MSSNKIIWGLTGGIGSGKSTVAKVLSSLGASIVDADAQARLLTEPGGAAIPKIVERWGVSILTAEGAMDRQAMREKVFQSPNDKRALEAIVHPLIAQATQQAIDHAHSEWVICDVPLLVESVRWRTRLRGVWVVDCSVATQVERVRQRNQWPDQTIHAVIAQQATRAQRLACADVVTFNEGCTLTDLKTLVGAQAAHIGLR